MKLGTLGRIINLIDKLLNDDLTEQQRLIIQNVRGELEELAFDSYLEDMGLMGGETE